MKEEKIKRTDSEKQRILKIKNRKRNKNTIRIKIII